MFKFRKLHPQLVKKYSELRVNRTKTSTVTPSFYFSSWLSLITTENCAKFTTKIWQAHPFHLKYLKQIYWTNPFFADFFNSWALSMQEESRCYLFKGFCLKDKVLSISSSISFQRIFRSRRGNIVRGNMAKMVNRYTKKKESLAWSLKKKETKS